MKTKCHDTYTKHLQLLDLLIRQSEFSYFHDQERALFEFILLQLSDNPFLTVCEVIRIRRFGSPSTVHKSLKKLIADGKLCTFRKEGDSRFKYIALADKGQNYVDLMNKSLSTLFTEI